MLETTRDTQTDKDKTAGRNSVNVREEAAVDTTRDIERNNLTVRQYQSTLNSQSSLTISNSDERSETSRSTSTQNTISSDVGVHTADTASYGRGHTETNAENALLSRY